MTEIKSFHPQPKKDTESVRRNIINVIESFRNNINSLDFLTKSFLAVILIVIAVTPIIVVSRFVFNPHAATNASLLFVDGSGSSISQTESTTVSVQLTSPWIAGLALTQPNDHFMAEVESAAVEGTSAYTIYDDILENGWTNGSTGETVNLSSGSIVYSGTNSISIDAKDGGIFKLNAPSTFSASSYTHLQFSVRATQSREDLEVYTENSRFPSLNKKVRLSDYGGYPSTTGWTVYTIPLADVNAVNRTIDDISMQNTVRGSAATFYIDQMQLINTSNPSPTVKPTSTPTPTPTMTPILYTVSATLAEDFGFTRNVKTISPFTANPYITTYTFISATPGTKTLYAKFTASDGSTQIVSNSIQLVSTGPTSTPTAIPTGGPPATIQSTTVLVSANGGRVDWSLQNSIAFSKFLNNKNGAEIYTMNPDGTNQACITCNNTQLSHISNDQPAWSPDGKYILFQSVDQSLYNTLPMGGAARDQIVQGGAGVDNNLWVITADGKSVTQLTHVAQSEATLHPHFSRDGKKLFWAARNEEKASNGLPLGNGLWMLSWADFVDDATGPHLSNIKTSQPLGSQVFYETHNYAPGRQTALFTTDVNPTADLHPTICTCAMNISLFNFSTGLSTQLTSTTDVWNEHAQFSPSGKKIVWISSQGYPFTPTVDWSQTLKTDLWMMNADGSNKQQLTFFNTPGSSQYNGGRVVLSDGSWNPKGDKYVMQRDNANSQVVVFSFSAPQ